MSFLYYSILPKFCARSNPQNFYFYPARIIVFFYLLMRVQVRLLHHLTDHLKASGSVAVGHCRQHQPGAGLFAVKRLYIVNKQ